MMRCLTIAMALKEALQEMSDTAEILFVCADADSAQLARDYGFEARVLGTNYRQMEEELVKWPAVIQAGKKQEVSEGVTPDRLPRQSIILVDSYYVTHNYLQELRSFGKVVLMDDLQSKRYPVDVVINYNAFTSKEIYEKLYAKSEVGRIGENGQCGIEGKAGQTIPKICAGSQYVPIRKQFRNQSYQINDRVERVLITTGGGDVDNIAGEILQVLLEVNGNIHFDLIIGRYNPHLKSFLKLQEANSYIHIHQDVRDMASLMKQCDVAITAGGTTIYELASIGVPFICFSYAENQELLTEYIGEKKIAGYAGAYHKRREATLKNMQQIFKELLHSEKVRHDYYQKERQMVDGLGAKRIVKQALLENFNCQNAGL